MKSYFSSAILVLTLFLSYPSLSQSISSIEKLTADCLNERVPAAEWTLLETVFEAYLIDNKFGSRDSVNDAYYRFIAYQGFFGSRTYPQLKDRAAVKAKMTQLGMIDGSSAMAAPFIQCFADPHPDYKNYPGTAITRFIAFAD